MKRTLLITTCLALLVATASAGTISYQIRDLGRLSGGEGWSWNCAYGISDTGLVAGDARASDGRTHTFLFDGTMNDLGTLPSGRPESHATGINNNGQVVGYSNTHPGDYADNHAFLYDGTMHDLGVLTSGGMSYAYSINNSGRVVGYSLASISHGLYYRAFLYDGTMHNLGALASTGNSYAYSINNSGQVVGYSWTSSGYDHAFLYDGTMHDLGTLPGGYDTYAYGISDDGRVVGYGMLGYLDSKGNLNYYRRAFLYDGTMRELGTLGGQYSDSYARSINDSGQVVGWALVGSRNHAFLYDGTMHDLNDLIDPAMGWTLDSAYDINNSGQIVGCGYVSGTSYIHAFLLIPVPESSSLLALICGLAGAGGFALRRHRS